LQVPHIDSLLGMEVYATKSEGVGGRIRGELEDFVVEEVLVDGSKAIVGGAVASRVLDSTSSRQHFLLCVLEKHGWDTFVAVKNVAKSMGVEQGRIQFAGIKDAKAITAQYVTVEGATIEDAAKVEVKDIALKPIGYLREALSLFYLRGNSFTITVSELSQNIPAAQEQIAETMREIGEAGGVPNFYGHQRFGTTRPITHYVGRALLDGNFEEAAMLFLAKPSPTEHPVSRQARQELWDMRDFGSAYETFPKQLRFERLMLAHLAQNPTDFAGAFRCLPPKLQTLFVQAHQSYLFNRFLSERLKRGLPLNGAVAGDFVVAVERNGLPLTSMAKVADEAGLVEVNTRVKAGRMRVALPIFGRRQKLSGGVMGEIEREVLQNEGVEGEAGWVNEFAGAAGKGGLRAVVTPVQDFSAHTSLGKAKLGFVLLRGSYATVVLREIMKPQDPVATGF
jgi:tRNA pseudouridine13 synthase